MAMPHTRPYSELRRERARSDPEFRRLMFLRAVRYLSVGDVVMGKETIHNLVDATVGFDGLGTALKKSPKGLKRMLLDDNRTCSADLSAIVEYLRGVEQVDVNVSCERAEPVAKTTRRKTGEMATA